MSRTPQSFGTSAAAPRARTDELQSNQFIRKNVLILLLILYY